MTRYAKFTEKLDVIEKMWREGKKDNEIASTVKIYTQRQVKDLRRQHEWVDKSISNARRESKGLIETKETGEKEEVTNILSPKKVQDDWLSSIKEKYKSDMSLEDFKSWIRTREGETFLLKKAS